jgi:hypothetical protein
MVNLACHAAWAPEDGLWTPWVKPILFAQMPEVPVPPEVPEGTPMAALDVPRLPVASRREALILDLPGAETMELALALARRGFRPVPLFNGTSGPAPVVDVGAVTRELLRGAGMLRHAHLPSDAPPAFLLDAMRAGGAEGAGGAGPGRYDNRWIVLPQDMPSGTFLLGHGVERVTLLRRGGLEPARDLAHVLLRWQEAGLKLAVVDLGSRQVAGDVTVRRPSMFRSTWYAAVALLGLRRHNMGGFGAPVPEQVAHRGFYG